MKGQYNYTWDLLLSVMPVFNGMTVHLELNIKYRHMTDNMWYSSKSWKWTFSWKSRAKLLFPFPLLAFAYLATE